MRKNDEYAGENRSPAAIHGDNMIAVFGGDETPSLSSEGLDLASP
jgi:hypothetical protein